MLTKKITNNTNKILKKEFFSRPSYQVAPDLIGCFLIKRISKNRYLSGVIVETEAYSQEEEACHGYNKKTPSNEVLFGEPGTVSYTHLTLPTSDLV